MNMETFSFCWEIIKREEAKFNVGIDGNIASQITAANATDFNFDIAHNRCSYLYRCGFANLSFAKECFSKFFSSYKDIDFLMTKWIKNSGQTTICSLSTGPALDYIAFLLSYQESSTFHCGDSFDSFLYPFKNVKLISKHGAWRNTVNIMDQLITEGYKSLLLPELIGNFEVIQGNPFINFTEKLKNPINESEAVIMMKTLNLQADGFDPDKGILSIQEFLAALKEDAVLFCIDTKPSITLLTEAISAFRGTYLLQPTFVNTLIQLENTDLYKMAYGCAPVLSARGSFLVWQKKSLSLPSPYDSALNRFSESIKTVPETFNYNSNCDKETNIKSDNNWLLNDKFYSTSYTQDKKMSALSECLKIETDEFLDNFMNIASQNTVSLSSSSSFKKEKCFLESDSVAVSTHVATADKSVQTAPENSFDNNESVKIPALTKKISNLVDGLKSVLNINEKQDFGLHSQTCLKSKNCASLNSVGSQCSCEHCSPEAFKCCSEGLQTSGNLEKRALKQYCSNHLHKQSSSHCSQCSSNASLCDFETNENCNSSCNAIKISTEPENVPKLVIPLNDLSGDVIAQIVALISKTNKNS